MHYYKRNLGDYAKKAGRLSMLQHGAYTLLIDACYDREQFPTKEEAIEWTWASSTSEVEAVEFVLGKFFVLEDGRYVQKRIQEELDDYHSKADKNKRIAIDRETKRRENSTNRAKASPAKHEPPPNQEPLTNNQEQEVNPLVSSILPTQICPQKEILSAYAELLPELPQPRMWGGTRGNHLTARWKAVLAELKERGKPFDKDAGIEYFRRLFSYIHESDFLMGRTSHAWQSDLGWILKSENFAKIIQGNYENKVRAA
jgi:uncharacterized protein YdaU (DUF1376 family)